MWLGNFRHEQLHAADRVLRGLNRYHSLRVAAQSALNNNGNVA